MPKDLKVFFSPSSVAIIGASKSSEKVGSIILRNIIKSGFKGSIYPINPKYNELEGTACFKSIQMLKAIPDLVVIATPAETVEGIVAECGEFGVKNIVVIAAGFKEVGSEGTALEQKLVSLCTKYGINLLGPNCMGFVNNDCPVNATFGESENLSGNLRFVSQSGAIAASLFDWCKSQDLGFSTFITLGNKADINENDVLHYFYERSKNTISTLNETELSNLSPIGLYLESIVNGSEFLNLITNISSHDPVLILKPGKTDAAASAMKSHTGSIAGADDVLNAALLKAGAVRCDTLEDFFEFSKAFAWEDIPLGPNVAVISNAGGPAVISADAIINEDLKLVDLDKPTRDALLKVLPRSSGVMNPIDVLGDALAERYANAAEIVLSLNNVDSLLIILTPQIMTQIEQTAEVISQLSAKYKKPIFCAFIGGTTVTKGEQILNKHKIPSFRFPERAIRAIGAMWKFKQMRDHNYGMKKSELPTTIKDPKVLKDVQNIISNAISENHKTLDNLSSDRVVSAFDIKTPPAQYIENLEQAMEFTKNYGWPVVLKLSSPGLLHKKEIGGVLTGIVNEEQLDNAFLKIQKKTGELDEKLRQSIKIQIQKEVVGGVEVIVGVKKDATFGNTLLFGAGGSHAELIQDKNLNLLPISDDEAKELIYKSKVFNLLKAQNGEPEYAIDKLAELIVRVSEAANYIDRLNTLEINPVIVTFTDVWAVDTKVVLDLPDKPKPTAPTLLVATTLSNKNLASKFNHYEFESDKPLMFKPGQYVSVKVASDAIRSYSVATSSSDTRFDLLVDTRPGGPGSRFFENLKPGDKMTYLGPFGLFTLRVDDGAEDLLFLATGSGASAIRCMIDKGLMELKLTKPMTFYFGLTYVEEIFWRDHFESLEKQYPNFKYKIAIFKPDETWKGAKGFITDLVKQDYPDSSKCAAYLCGHPAMITSATDLLLSSGTPKERIYTERFL